MFSGKVPRVTLSLLVVEDFSPPTLGETGGDALSIEL